MLARCKNIEEIVRFGAAGITGRYSRSPLQGLERFRLLVNSCGSRHRFQCYDLTRSERGPHSVAYGREGSSRRLHRRLSFHGPLQRRHSARGPASSESCTKRFPTDLILTIGALVICAVIRLLPLLLMVKTTSEDYRWLRPAVYALWAPVTAGSTSVSVAPRMGSV